MYYFYYIGFAFGIKDKIGIISNKAPFLSLYRPLENEAIESFIMIPFDSKEEAKEFVKTKDINLIKNEIEIYKELR